MGVQRENRNLPLGRGRCRNSRSRGPGERSVPWSGPRAKRLAGGCNGGWKPPLPRARGNTAHTLRASVNAIIPDGDGPPHEASLAVGRVRWPHYTTGHRTRPRKMASRHAPLRRPQVSALACRRAVRHGRPGAAPAGRSLWPHSRRLPAHSLAAFPRPFFTVLLARPAVFARAT